MPSSRLGLDGVRSSSTLRIFFMGAHYNRPHEKTQVQMKDYKLQSKERAASLTAKSSLTRSPGEMLDEESDID
jgi:hypothetical protein